MRKKEALLTLPALAVAALLAAPQAEAQTTLEQVVTDGDPLPLGDLDGDGVRELMIRAPHHDAPFIGEAGKVTIVSGADLSPLHEKVGTAFTQRLGLYCARMGDVDHDGVPDYFVGSKTLVPLGPGGTALYSGATHAVLMRFACDIGVDRVGDVDQDGADDFAVQPEGALEIRSGADGSVIRSDPFSYHSNVVAIGDADLDGVEDYVVALANSTSNGGHVRIVSGANGDTLHLITGAANSFLGHSAAAAGDLDGDGHADVLLGSVDQARAYSGTTGAPLLTLDPPPEAAPYPWFGSDVEGNVDLDHDGVPDVLVAARWHALKLASDGETYGDRAGRVLAYTGATGARLFDVFGAEDYRFFGQSLREMGDRDGDGTPDLVVGHALGFDIVSGHGADAPLGTTLLATIAKDDFDEAFVYGLKGTKLKIRAWVDAGDADPRVSVRRGNDQLVDALDFDYAKDGTPSAEKTKLKKTGLHRLRALILPSQPASSGDVRVEVEVTYPKTARARTVTRKAKPGKTLDAEMAAVPGATLNATLELKKGYAAPPPLTVTGPDGQGLDAAPYVTTEPGFLHLTGMPVDEVGVYRLEVPAGTVGKSKVVFHLDPAQPPPGPPIEID